MIILRMPALNIVAVAVFEVAHVAVCIGEVMPAAVEDSSVVISGDDVEASECSFGWDSEGACH